MKLVLCEGEDDQAVLRGLVEHSELKEIRIELLQGRDRLNEVLRNLPKRPEFTRLEVESLGIVLDADQDRTRVWQRVKDLVKQAFGTVLAEEAAFAGERPRIGAYICGCGEQGTLEDVCLGAVAGQPGFACLEEYFRCLRGTTRTPSYPGKARFRAWMASQTDYDLRLGKAATSGYLPWGNAAFDGLRGFLRSL